MIDGPVLLAEALDADVQLHEVFAAPGADDGLVERARAAGATVHRLEADVLKRAVDTVTPQDVAAIAARAVVPLAEAVAAAARGPFTLVLVDVSDPGNAGTLLRAAEASGASAVLFCGTSVDPCNPKCVRASAGALFHLPVADGGDAGTVLEELAAEGVRTVATVVRGGVPYDEADLRGPVAVILGSEAHGLPASLVDKVDVQCTIPMEGRSESLNVAMAGSVLAFEALRQRRSGAS
ncbi:MAG: RNA methyltransferase [Actinomycetota bacterium]|nr:RNA methyltransferase [Actinomycetota bacterium]